MAGNAQGTTWQITWVAENNSDHKEGFKEAIDSIFKAIDLSLSTYVPASIISRINKNDPAIVADDHFINVFNKSIGVSQKTNGLFDITVAPIINAWGFGFTKKASVNSVMIDSLLDFVGYKMVRLEGKKW
ncbi:MAG: FAD:protein FMN transferase [Bacteroidia bacterium]|nr:FAD:protein FMN transferase [Bacteroidia bacterium]